jgi:hypothetical protein
LFALASVHAGDVNAADSNISSEDVSVPLADAGDAEPVESDIDENVLAEEVKNRTELTSPTDNVYYKGSYSLTLRDSNSTQAISNRTVNFIINDANFTATTDADGIASVALSLTPGKYGIFAFFAGDDDYLASDNFTSTFQVLPTVKAADITKYYKGTTQYSATFFDSQGNFLANKQVKITVSGKSYSKKTDSKGHVSLAVDLKPGTYKIVATDPVTGYKSTTTFTILSTIVSSNLNKVKGDGRKFVVKFFKSDGKPLSKQYVKIKINGKTRKYRTNSKGQVILTMKKYKTGKYNAVIYGKDGLIKTNTIRIVKIATTRLTTGFYTFLPGDDRQIRIKFSTSLGGDSNSGKTIKIRFNGKTHYKKTDGKGIICLNAPSKKGVYAIECSYNGNRFYKSSKTSNLVTVIDNPEPKLTVKSTTRFGYGAGTLFRVALTAGGVPLVKRTVTFTIGSKKYTANTDNSGIASIPINLKIGKYTADYKTPGKFRINGTSGSCEITVFKRSPSKFTWKCGNTYKDSAQPFKILLTDSKGNAVSGQTVELTIDGETHTAKTTSNGYATIKTYVALGKYRVSVKFKGSNDYLSSQASKSVNVKLSMFGKGLNEKNAASYLGAFLKSSSHSKVNSAKVKALVKSLTKGKKSRVDKAKAIYNFVRDNIRYSYYYNSLHGSTGTLKAKSGNCVDQAHLLVAMYRTAGFKARYVHGKCTFSDGRFGHVWTQVLIGKHWVCGDPISSRNALGKIANWNTHTYHVHAKYQSLPF